MKSRRYSKKRIRILLAKAGLDGHDRGIKIIAMALRDAGMEVIYLGLRQTSEEIVNAALEEDVDVIGISLLSGAHNQIFPKLLKLMKGNGLKDRLLIGGGIIPKQDIERLKKKGVAEIFTPGASTEEIVRFILMRA
ncbi:MAG: cobalamin B12-binding domain-containing protein [Nitrospirae bacterium]|nr:cobalamin B12-binding domain-containing protein [Nitrospirota bacterium]